MGGVGAPHSDEEEAFLFHEFDLWLTATLPDDEFQKLLNCGLSRVQSVLPFGATGGWFKDVYVPHVDHVWA